MPSSTISTRWLFAAASFLAASLVFLVQPMVAKQLLPTFGGTPGVWNTAVVFFQVMLLAGYAFAHVTLRLLGARRQIVAQLVLVALAVPFLPFVVRTAAPPDGVSDSAWLLLLLAASVAIPYVAVTTASIVLQRWYSVIGLPDSDDPYFLYAASNAGSLTGLLAYPFVLEPRLTTSGQEWVWTVAFGAYVVFLATCAVMVRRASSSGTATSHDIAPAQGAEPRLERVRIGRSLRWIAVAAVPSALMLGVTSFITTDVANAPLLWVLPLALYLVSFMVTFGRRVQLSVDVAGVLAAVTAVLLLLIEMDVVVSGQLGRTAIHLLAMTTAAVLAHAWLYRDRPDAAHLTWFYLMLSVGGAIGGAFTALVAPVAFDRVVEYPALLAAALLLRPRGWRGPARLMASSRGRVGLQVVEMLAAVGVLVVLVPPAITKDPFEFFAPGPAALVVLLAAMVVLVAGRWGFVVAICTMLVLISVLDERSVNELHRERGFFGSMRVDEEAGVHRFFHGTTLHGSQARAAALLDEPRTYYTRGGPFGDVIEALESRVDEWSAVVVGLGTGTIAAYAEDGDELTFFEIDPAVVAIAENERWFSFLDRARARGARVDTVVGDARLQLDGDDGGRDLIVLDAYSSDAVPVHLLTVEAIDLYMDRLADGGMLAFHVSSRHLDLSPVVAAAADELGLDAWRRRDRNRAAASQVDGASASTWIVVARPSDVPEHLRDADGWEPLKASSDARPWTDDFSNIADMIVWLP